MSELDCIDYKDSSELSELDCIDYKNASEVSELDYIDYKDAFLTKEEIERGKFQWLKATHGGGRPPACKAWEAFPIQI